MSKYTNRKPAALIIGASILTAAWLIVGPSVLKELALPTKIIDLLVLVPAMMAAFWVMSGNKGFMACEYRAWKRIFGK